MKPVALVTGGNRGIGRAIVGALAARGFDIVFADLEETGDTAVTRREAEALGAVVRFVSCDIARIDQHERLLQEAARLGGAMDVLVNNAGVSVARRGDLLDVGPESFDRVLGINLRGTFFLSQAVARHMLATPSASAAPRSIITISSVSAALPSPDRAEYCLSKAALSMMVKLLALRLAEAGIAAYEVQPGVIRTDMTKAATEKYDRLIANGLTPIARWGEPDDVGRVVATLACGALPFVTGEVLRVDGGLHIHRL